jgi:hypothetical protein
MSDRYRSDSLCFGCGRKVSECRWLQDAEPIDGWETSTRIVAGNHGPGQMVVTCVKVCPLYKPGKTLTDPDAPPLAYCSGGLVMRWDAEHQKIVRLVASRASMAQIERYSLRHDAWSRDRLQAERRYSHGNQAQR